MKSHATYAGDPRRHAEDLAELRAEVERLRNERDEYAYRARVAERHSARFLCARCGQALAGLA